MGALCGHLCKDGWTDRDAVCVMSLHGFKKSCVIDGSPQMLKDVAMATSFGTQFDITGFLAFHGL